LEFLDGSKLVRWSRLLTFGNVMDIDYLTDDVTVRLCPLDMDKLRQCPTPLYIGVMDAVTGESRYLNSHTDDLISAFRATCALPGFYRPHVHYNGRRYIDGGVSDPVPIRKALELGATELTVVLTSSIESRTEKRWQPPGWLRFMSSAPAVRKALADRHLRYRDVAELLSNPGPDIRIDVVRPSRPLPVGRATRDRRKLEQACDLGYEDGKKFIARTQELENSRTQV
jgi:predicted patatin/cPLA2 family phospholipase